MGSAMLRYAREQLATEPMVGTAVCTTIQGLPVATCTVGLSSLKTLIRGRKSQKDKKNEKNPNHTSKKQPQNLALGKKRGKILKKAIAGAGGTKTLLSTIQN